MFKQDSSFTWEACIPNRNWW